MQSATLGTRGVNIDEENRVCLDCGRGFNTLLWCKWHWHACHGDLEEKEMEGLSVQLLHEHEDKSDTEAT